MRQGAHGGDVYSAARYLGVPVESIMDYSSNVSPYPVSLSVGADVLTRLPEPHSETLARHFAEKHGYDASEVCITSGTTEAIETICRINTGKSLFIHNPTYADYAHYADVYGLDILGGLPADVAFVCNPNNPTGQTCPREYIPDYIRQNPDTLFVYDESYMPFHTDEASQTLLGERIENLLILRSFSKIYGLPGLRLGAVVGSAEAVGAIRSIVSPWSVNSYAQAAGVQLLDVDTAPIAARLAGEKENFLQELAGISWIAPQKSDVNYMLCRLQRGTSAGLFEHCLKKGVLIRDCANFDGLDDSYIRIAMREEMGPLLDAFRSF